jgi:hypothetical protein
MEMLLEPEREIPVSRNVDVLVIGGGPAGCAAAIFAARMGAKTLVAEKDAFLGGMATQGLFARWPRDRGLGLYPYGGVPKEIADHMSRAGWAIVPEIKPRKPGSKTSSYNDMRYNEEMLKLILGEMLRDSGGEVLYHSPGVSPVMEDGVLRGVIVENKSGRQAIRAKVVIDASGDADIAARAGAPFEMYAKNAFQAPVDKSPFTPNHEGALTPFDMRFIMNNIDLERLDRGAVRACWEKTHDPEKLVQLQGFKEGEEWKKGMVTFALLVRGKDASDAMDLNYGEIVLKQAILDFVRALHDCPGFENAHLIKMTHQAEVRATRRVVGDYTLTKNDCVQGKRFADAIAVTPPRGQHLGAGKALADVPPGTQILHGIPYRSIVPKNVEGLLTAGRCISTEFEALQGHLSIPGCMLVGQGAGAAAAIAARENVLPRQVDVSEVQRHLEEMGAELKDGIA